MFQSSKIGYMESLLGFGCQSAQKGRGMFLVAPEDLFGDDI